MSRINMTTDIFDEVADVYALHNSMSEGACFNAGPDINKAFFSEDPDAIAFAVELCSRCSIAATCLEGAIARREPWGIWGGYVFRYGKILSRLRKMGRPARNAPSSVLPYQPSDIPVEFRQHIAPPKVRP